MSNQVFKGFTLVESPYNSPHYSRESCIRYALWCCYDATINLGEAVFGSHLFYTQFLPEDKPGRTLGLAARDYLAHITQARVARYLDLGPTAGMYRDCDCVRECVDRKLPVDLLAKWANRVWPDGSVRLVETCQKS